MYFAKKSIVLLENPQMSDFVKSIAGKIQLESDSDFQYLSSFKAIKERINETKNAAFLRTELFNFISKFGYPSVIILDLKSNLNLDKELDSDNMKIFKTFLISYIVFSMSVEFSDIKGNFYIIHESNDPILEKLKLMPFNILDHLHTHNELVNKAIAALKINNKDFTKLFNIHYFDKALLNSNFEKSLMTFNTSFQMKQDMNQQNIKKNLSSLSNKEQPPANAIFRINNDKMYIDGTLYENYDDEYKAFPEKMVVIEGAWTSRTLRAVTENIIKTVKIALKESYVKKDGELSLLIGDSAEIDGSVASYLAQIILGDLKIFSKVKVFTNHKNDNILRASTGYSMIREYVKIFDR